MWKHNEKYSEELKLILHDCVATRVFIESGALCFEFADGFWCLHTHENNPYNDTIGTDLSLIKISNFEIESIYIFDEKRMFHRVVSTKRRYISLEELIENINSGKWQLEFLYDYHAFGRAMFDCLLYMKKKPYAKECQISLRCDEIEYFWNNLCTDRSW